MSVSIHNVVIDCANPETLSDFWAKALGYEREVWPGDVGAMVFDPNKQDGVRLLILKVPESKVVKNRVHIDVEPKESTRRAEVERLIELGASFVEDKSLPFDPPYHWTIMQDPEGNEFCVGMGATPSNILEE